jgi:hydrogenase nickel incorporation protein HypA/HybF
MHEWALADAVLEATTAAMVGRAPGCLRTVTILMGELQAIERSIFDVALRTLLEEKPFRQAAFVVETEPAAFQCRACGAAWDLAGIAGLDAESREAIHFLPEAAHAFISCPSCGSPDFTLLRGRGVSIREIALSTTGECA